VVIEGILIVEDTKKGLANGKVVMTTGSEERKALCQLTE